MRRRSCSVGEDEDNPMKQDTVINALVACALAAAALVAGTTRASVGAAISGDPAHGKALYQACQACHSIDDNDLGPKHRGVVGRRAGSVADYNYSMALKNSGLTWDPTTLDRWLSNPSALVPGTKMYFTIADAQSRADIIAYLAQLK